MTKKQSTLYGAIGLMLGIVGGIAGTAFSMGAERQRINDKLITLEAHQVSHEEDTGKEVDRYAEIIAAHITQLQTNIASLTATVSDLRTDVQVLKAIMERMEKDIQTRTAPD